MAASQHLVSYPRFLGRLLWMSTDGSWRFYTWMTVLTCIALVGANAWARQLADGMVVTGMSDHVAGSTSPTSPSGWGSPRAR